MIDLPYLLKRLLPCKELRAPLQVNIPDTCIFSKGLPRFISCTSQMSPFMKVMKLFKNREKLMLSQIRKFFQEKPEILDNNDIHENARAEEFLRDGRDYVFQKTSKKKFQDDIQYTMCFDHEVYDHFGNKSLVNYFARQNSDSIWKTIKFIQRKIPEDSEEPNPIRYDLPNQNQAGRKGDKVDSSEQTLFTES